MENPKESGQSFDFFQWGRPRSANPHKGEEWVHLCEGLLSGGARALELPPQGGYCSVPAFKHLKVLCSNMLFKLPMGFSLYVFKILFYLPVMDYFVVFYAIVLLLHF